MTQQLEDSVYQVYVSDRGQFGDVGQLESEFDNAEAAIEFAKDIVDSSLKRGVSSCDTAESLFLQYMGFGEYPSIEHETENVSFSAKDYAEKRCVEIFKDENGTTE